ncbi:hypothetical protein BRADI_3g01460v3 [Brachypodium distachyon]|nr:hypothetical protein BRADI_3g01460v3 [Brachypodium distachyon]PNT65726.1 hypothetical protein BRADI_3g01460v3 [Brachypodium distachyon]
MGLDDTQFRNEFNHLMRTEHPNITRLVGYCYNQGHQRIKYNGEYIFANVEERVLCFEYLQGGSLDKHISAESCGLDWHTRFNIIRGICDGLNYLHNGSQDPIYHLDLKPANILLDDKMIPKIGDFGLSRLFPLAQTYITTKIIGTRGYMPPEYINRCEITLKFDVYSLGVIIIQIMAGYEGYSKFTDMSSQKFLKHVIENWDKQLQVTMSSHAAEQVKKCIEIALRCVVAERENRPTIAEIVNELNKIDTADNLPAGQVINFRSKHAFRKNSNSEPGGRIVFSRTNGTLVSFDIFSSPLSPSSTYELPLTDGVSYNYNGQAIPPAALKTLLKNPKLADKADANDADIDAGNVSGLIFVSERDNGLETLYIALHFNAGSNILKVIALADIFGAADFSGVRLEDSGCIGGGYSVGCRTVDHCLIYVSTKEAAQERRSPWTVVYKTNLTTGKTERLTPQGVFDLSPAVSPSGMMVAVASFESKSWNGELENLKTDIYVMNVDSEGQLGRKLLIKNGGWPSWGSDNIIFFHRGTEKTLPSTSRMVVETAWGVFRYNISTQETVQVTPEELDAMTPAAISETKVAVATIRQNVPVQYRHIEIFDMNAASPVQITQKTSPECDHYNPFMLDGGGRIGYHRSRTSRYHDKFYKLESPSKDVGLYRASGMFPAISKDGSKLAFVDDKSKVVWLADSQGLRIVYEQTGSDSVFSPVWNQDSDKDILYICVGPSLESHRPLEIYSITNISSSDGGQEVRQLTCGKFNNAFPSSSPDGGKLVFQSTRDFWPKKAEDRRKKHRNLHIMLNAAAGELDENCWVTRLTKGSWTDTQCQWSPRGDWIVFLSTRDRQLTSNHADELEYPVGYLSVFLVKAYDPMVVVRIMDSGADPVFSPDGRSIAVTADFSAVSVDPISLPKLARLCSNIFLVDINTDDDTEEKNKQEDVVKWLFHHRMTHSRYGCGKLAWTTTRVDMDPEAPWKMMELGPNRNRLPKRGAVKRSIVSSLLGFNL